MIVQEDQLTEISGETEIKPGRYARQRTIQYKTFLKRAIAEALMNAFNRHPDPSLKKTKVGIEYATDRADFPAIVIKFYEKDIRNAGVGHIEWGPDPSDPKYPDGPTFERFIPYSHRTYHGDIEFEVLAQSSLDRDKVVDALIEVLAMGEVSVEGETFLNRIYKSFGTTPFSEWHFIALNTDLISGYGEQQMNAPWFAEDVLMYQTAYRLPIFGEFYSLTPAVGGASGLITEVDIYPWDEADPTDIPPADFPEDIIPDEDYIKITKRPRLIPVPEEHEKPAIEGVLETSPTQETSPTLETKGS
jgi:hypothetical protein